MQARLGLIRPVNALMSAAAVGIGSVVAVGLDAALVRLPAVVLGGLTVFLFTGAGNALNDFYDRDADRVNHPERAIPSGGISPRGAFDLALALFALAILASLAINLPALGLVLLSLLLMVAYEVRFKTSGFAGNLLIGWLVGSLFLFAGLVVYEGAAQPLQIAGSLAVLAGLSTVGREIVKDVEDIAGDAGRTSLPRRHGVPAASRIAQAFFVLAVVLSAVPALLGILGIGYVPVVALADAIFIYAAFYSTRAPRLSERAAKGAMVVALAAFLVGGLG